MAWIILPRLSFPGAALLLQVCYLGLLISGTQASIQGLVNLTKVSVAELAEELVKIAIPGVNQRIITDVQDGGHRLVEIFQDSNDTVLGCNALGSKNLIDTVLNVIPEDMLTKVTKDEMQYFLDLCDNRDQNVPQGPIKSIFDFIGTTLKSLLIFPGTKWCGAGDVAKNYDDLGRESVTDMCCRDHDHATDSLAPFETVHGVTNVMLYTMTNCQDDCNFYNCLLEVNSLAGNAMGTIFFDTLKTNCFAYGYPDKCVSRNWISIPLLAKSCKQYQPDTSKSQKWQTYPQPSYSGAEHPRNCTQYN